MIITLTIQGNTTSTDLRFTTKTANPYEEARRALLRLVRIVEEADGAEFYNVFLKSTPKKIDCIKVVHQQLKIGLKEAKDEVDKALEKGVPLAKLQTHEQAEAWRKAFYGRGECVILAAAE